MNRFFFQSLIIVLTFLAIFIWQKSILALYTVPLLGILTALYLIASFKRKGGANPGMKYRNQILTVFLLTTSSLLLIQATGGINSMLFFLLYFLSFYIGFTLIPETVFVFSIGIFLLFYPQASEGNTLFNLTKLFSFFLLCPLAYFFGKEIAVREKREQKIAELQQNTSEKAEKIIKDVEAVVKNEGKMLKEQDLEKLKDIVDQSRKLEEETK